VLRSQHRVYDGRGEVTRTQDVWGAEGISGRVKFLLLAWAGMPKTSSKNSDSPLLSFTLDVSPAMALKLSKVLGRSPESWLQMQDNFNLHQAKKELDLSEYEPLYFMKTGKEEGIISKIT
jgi:hypothetical protein